MFLLMLLLVIQVEARRKNIVCPNKHREDHEKTYRGHVLESETYIGGHVECLQSGVFRADLKYHFELDPNAFQMVNSLIFFFRFPFASSLFVGWSLFYIFLFSVYLSVFFVLVGMDTNFYFEAD